MSEIRGANAIENQASAGMKEVQNLLEEVRNAPFREQILKPCLSVYQAALDAARAAQQPGFNSEAWLRYGELSLDIADHALNAIREHIHHYGGAQHLPSAA